MLEPVDELARPGATIASSCSLGVRPSGEMRAEPGDQLVLQAGDADLEELVEVLAEDGAELGPLEQRHAVVGRRRQDAGVEVEPRQLPVEEALRSRSGAHGRRPASRRRPVAQADRVVDRQRARR